MLRSVEHENIFYNLGIWSNLSSNNTRKTMALQSEDFKSPDLKDQAADSQN